MLTSTSHDLLRPAIPVPPGRPAYRPEQPRFSARPDAPGTVRNKLLSALPADDLAQVLPLLERLPLKPKQVLQERNLPITHVYFIERGAASLLSRAGERGTVEVGTIGSKDLAGMPVVLGTARSPHRCVMLVEGEALRIRAEDLTRAMDGLPALRQLLLGYVQAAMVESAQLVVCGNRHGLHERLARWLLVARDRLDGVEFPLTHQTLSRALGVRRASITTALGRLEQAGLIRRGRGRLEILDGEGLEGACCECYRAIRSEHHRLLPTRACVGIENGIG